MIKKRFFPLAILTFTLIFVSCNDTGEQDEIVTAQTIIPGSDMVNEENDDEERVDMADAIVNSPQILIDRDYTVYDIRNINLDDDEIEEQVILASPLNEDKDVFRIYIADFDEQRGEYSELFTDLISYNNLNLASIETDDLTGDHLQEVIITGIDTKDQQVMEVFKIMQGKEAGDIEVREVFSQAVDGDFEIIQSERGNDYKIEELKGESFSLEIQKKNPDDDKNLIVESYKWNEDSVLYELSSSEKVRISSLSNENLLNFYRGSSEDYLEFLSGPWFKTKDLYGNPTHNMSEIFQLLPDEKTLTFYSGDIQESFVWTEQNEPVKYRHALSFWEVRNNILRSMYFNISIYINSFESIQIKIRGNQRWGGTYTQLSDNLQKALTDTSRENSLLSEMEIKGLYKTNLNSEILFDSPEYILREEGVETKGIFTIFELDNDTILQMKELSENGLTKDVRTYKMDYSETSDDLRIIRTITLQKGELRSRGIVEESNSELHFEQIEKINQDLPENQS